MNGKFWENKKVLITGHTGFKGSWLSLWLQAKCADTIGYALPPPTKPSLFEVANVGKEMVSIIGDIRDLENLQTVITKHRPEIIIHLAAKPLVRYSYKNPLETYSTNVMGTINVLEAVRQSNSVKVAVIITSDKCYENREWLWGYRENEAMGGHDPYSSSKGCAELVASAYRRSYFSDNNSTGHQVHMATTRTGNVVGGSKAKSLLGWLPQIDLTTALNWIVKWYKAYLQKRDMHQFTQTQIFRYERMSHDWNDDNILQIK